jgi:hypothetical protein
MQTFTEREARLIARLQTMPPQSVLKFTEPCPLHSYCNPLPLFRVYKMDDERFEAQWNNYHEEGPKQVFAFDKLN